MAVQGKRVILDNYHLWVFPIIHIGVVSVGYIYDDIQSS